MSAQTLRTTILPFESSTQRYNIETSGSQITSIQPAKTDDSSSLALLLPTLCHPHIHLDKGLLLTSHGPAHLNLPDYSDLAPTEGMFAEALRLTSSAKQRYTHDDLVYRGSQVIAESVRAGVTSMRAFVEVDHVTNFKCIEAGVALKRKFEGLCHVQLCVFAQDPVINAEKHGNENRDLVEEALDKFSDAVEVLGSTPYVEGSVKLQGENVEWAVRLAKKHKLLLDFHLDYNLDGKQKAMVWDVLEVLRREDWVRTNPGKTVVLGHCTRLSLFEDEEMRKLANDINKADDPLPVHFVGLPTSDLFMMGRPSKESSCSGYRPRGTLQVVDMIRTFGLSACIGINNVGNAFTPWGSLDPLKLASLGVGIYQAGTQDDAKVLFECVSTRARNAICAEEGLKRQGDQVESFQGLEGSHLAIRTRESIEVLGHSVSVQAKRYLNIADVVWDPPDLSDRMLVVA